MYQFLASAIRDVFCPERSEDVHPSPCHALLPGDLLLLVASYLSAPDLVSTVQTCKHYYNNIVPELYSSVTLKSADQCLTTLGMLSRREDVARHVTALAIKLGKSADAAQQRTVCAMAVRNLAASGALDALGRFDWNAEEIPPHDDMWCALRRGCSRLRHIGISLGYHLPMLNSHIFKFNDLEGFSLSLKQRFYTSYGETFESDDHPVLQAFWNLLSEKSPNLRELSLTGETPTSDIVVISGLMKRRWPELQRLTLGDVCIDPPFIPSPTSAEPIHPFITFLEAHPKLKSISLSRHNVPVACLNSLSPGALEKVTEFTGTLEQLQALPQIHPSVRSVRFNDSMRTREFTPPAVVAALQNLPRLANLEISLILNSVYDSNSLLRGIVQGCPYLRRLSMTCTEKPSFQVDSFARSIRALSRLEQLELTIVQYPGDDSISIGAARIAQNNPHLHTFSLTFLPTSTPLRLPFSIPYLSLPVPVNEAGRYTVTCDRHGLPQFLAAVERRRRPWPYSSQASTKRHTDDLRPAGYPGKRHINGLLGLTLERSQAGEEIRMMLFSVGLVTLAIWGFVGAMAMKSASV